MVDFNVKMSKNEVKSVVKLHGKKKLQDQWDREVKTRYYYNIFLKLSEFIKCHRIKKEEDVM